MSARPLTIPGRRPAANSPPMEMFATTPIMMRSIEGGTSCEVPPAAAINAVAKGRGYLRFSISGSVTEPTAAVSALADPQIPEKNMVERIATIPHGAANLADEEHGQVDDPGGDSAPAHDRAGEDGRAESRAGGRNRTRPEPVAEDDEEFGREVENPRYRREAERHAYGHRERKTSARASVAAMT